MSERLERSSPERLSPTGLALIELKDKIVGEWERRVRAELDGARDLAHPILVETISPYLDNVAEALSPAHDRVDGAEFSALAQEHGGDRARLTFYDPDELVREYQVLKNVIFDCLGERVKITREDRLIIHQCIDVALREAVTAFALIQSEVRQQFTATLTHDLRSPISVIKMAADLLGDEIQGNEAALSLLARILNNAKRADGMIQNLLDATAFKASGRLRLELHQTDMLELVRGVVKELTMSHGDRFRVSGSPVAGYWGVDALTRALENLCNNAIKYGDPKRPVAIRIEDRGARVVVSIHNDGPPIPVAEQEAIFQVYRRADAAKRDNQKGWGLGLPLARGVAESRGGSLSVVSREGHGTTFSIDIPKDAAPFQDATAG